MSIYSYAIDSYTKGNWKEVKWLFERAKEVLDEQDVPIDNLISYKSKYNFDPIEDWNRY